MSKDLFIDPLFVELLGAFIGDGWIEKRGSALYICGSPTEDKWHYDTFIAPVFSKYFAPVNPKLFPYWGVYGIVSYKKAIIKKALSLGFHSGDKARCVSFPQEVLDAKAPEIFKAAIRGVFDTDGSFHTNKQRYANNRIIYHGRISIALASKSLFDQLLVLFSKVGFSCRTSFSPKRRTCNRNNSASYRLMINKQSEVDRFFVEVGTNNLRHASRYLFFKKYGYIPADSSVDTRLALL